MKVACLILLWLFSCFQLHGQYQSTDATAWQRKMKKREISGAKIGDLICLNDYGLYVICTGNEFEKIQGFCTNTPYITVNKAKGDNKITEHKGIASFENGRIKTGDYLCPCNENPGQVVRCKKKDYPYGKALATPSEAGALFPVKILGHRRKY